MAVVVCVILAQPRQGRIIYVDADASGANNGASWSDAYRCLQDALAVAQYTNEVRVAEGIYKPDQHAVIDAHLGLTVVSSGDRAATFQLKNGCTIRGGYAGLGQTDPNARDIEAHRTILSGDLKGDDAEVIALADLLIEHTRSENSYHVVTGSGVEETAVLDGFMIVAGNANGPGINYNGGGMYNYSGSPTVTNCTFSTNTAGSDGGGMCNYLYSSPAVTNCTFIANTVISTDDWTGGGGMCNYFYSSPNVNNCTFSTNAVISLNEVSGGGGICNLFYSSPIVTNCTFGENSANNGGGIVNVLSTPTLTDCMFIGNFVNIAGGGVVNLNCSLAANNCMFIGNSACFGGGMSNDGQDIESCPELINCTFSRNFALFNGGGMHNYHRGSPTLINCTFSENQALDYGGGIDNEYGSNPTLTNCILWGNKSPRGPQIALWHSTDTGPSNLAISYSNVQGGQAAVYCELDCTLDWGVGNIDEDPLFLDPDGLDNKVGTEDDNLRLLINSPCIDAGTNSTPIPLPSTDLDGDQRILDGIVDMGAYEGAKGTVMFALSTESVTIPEGQTATFTVALSMDPQQTVEVTVTFQSGDLDIAVQSGTSLTFNSSNYFVPQAVTLAAAEDEDYLYGTAFISVTVPGVVSTSLTAVERDNEPAPSVLFVDGQAHGANDGTDWANAFCDLQTALNISRSATGVEEIRVAAGTYTPADPLGDRTAAFELVSGVAIYGGFPPGSDWEDRDPNAYETILSGDLNGNDGPNDDNNDDNSYHVVSCNGVDPNTILDGFTITAGNANGSIEHNVGGGMYNFNGNPKVTNCTFSGNSARFSGGMYNYGGSPVITNCTFSGNSVYAWGGGMYNYKSRPVLTNCTFSGNSAGGLSDRYGGGICCEASEITIADCNITNNIPDGVWMAYTDVQIDGIVQVFGNNWVGKKLILTGDGTLLIDPNSNLDLHNCTIRCNLSGPGTVYVGFDSELIIAGDAIIDLDHGTNPAANGQIMCHGLLRLQDNTTVTNAQVYVTRASFEDNAIVANCVINAEAGAPYGQFFIEDNVHIWLDKIEADGDRYLDLDPKEFDCNGIHVDAIEVNITEGVGGSYGGLFELRGQDMEIPPCDPSEFLCQIESVPDFGPDTWTIDRLELVKGAKLNLTNRFDFQAPYETGGDDEVLYVKQLVLGPNSILNTAFNRVYYETLKMDPTARLVCIPLLGFSLNNISFDDENDFLTRVKHNNLEHPDNPAFDRVHIERVTDIEPDPNGMMRMCNLKERDPNSSEYGKVVNARAKGLFAKSNENQILILFEYLFCTSEPEAEMVIYLSDVPELQNPRDPDHYIEVIRLQAPPPGRAGSKGSERFGIFKKTVSTGHLNFIKGTRIEFELIGPDGASVLIDDWDPEVHCEGICMDLNWSDAPDEEDFLIVVRECGEAAGLLEDGTSSRVCLDGAFSTDGFVDTFDIASWDWALRDPERVSRLNMCGVPFSEEVGTTSSAIGSVESSAVLLSLSDPESLSDLLIVGKRGTSEDPTALKSQDRLYSFKSNGLYVEYFDPKSDHCNIKLVKGPEGQLYQINIEEGVSKLNDDKVIIPPGEVEIVAIKEPRYNKSATVYIGIQDEGPDSFGRPILDVAFDADYAYVVPVVVEPDGEDAYAAAAKLQLLASGNPPYEVVQLYDDPPPSADNQSRNNIREIEIDSAGNVYVVNVHSLNESDILWKYAPDGTMLKRLDLCSPDSEIYIPDPIAMHISDSTDMLYLTSAQYDQADVNSTVLYGFSTEEALTLKRSITIDNMQHVTGITENPATGSLWAVGFNMENIPDFPNPTKPPFYYPILAKIPYGDNNAQLRALLGPYDLGLPMSIVWTATADKCGGADLNESGNVNFTDFAILAQYWLDSNCSPTDWCAGADVNKNTAVDTIDLAILSWNWLETDCDQ
ncbi:MAG: dockerin type I domain-containing protein [Planctomycetota bacterium]